MRTAFVEYRDPLRKCFSLVDLLKDTGDYRFIALTPHSANQLAKKNIGFSIPEDHYLWQEDERYKIWFQGWLQELEKIIVSYYPSFAGLDIPITIHCLTMLKNMMDSYIRTTIQYFKIVGKDEKTLILTDKGLNEKIKDVIDDELYFKYPSIYYRLIRKECEIEYSNKIYERKNKIRDWCRCFQFLPSWKGNKTLLFASPIIDRIREAKLRGYKMKILPIPKLEFYDSISSYISFDSLSLNSLFQSIDREFDFPEGLSERILWPRISYFLIKIVAEIKFYSEWYKRYFQDNDFFCLVFNRRNQLYLYGALIAARKVGLKTCYIRHGWDAFSDGRKGCWWRAEQRLRSFDYFVTPNKLDKEYYEELVKEKGLKTKIL